MKFIDLGLSVKWADCNFGAEFPEVFGLYQNWNEATERNYPEGQLPTKEQLEELKEKCKWTWTKRGIVKGCEVTGPNGNSIFLPATGYYFFYYRWFNVGTSGYYLDYYNGNVSSTFFKSTCFFPVRLVKE